MSTLQSEHVPPDTLGIRLAILRAHSGGLSAEAAGERIGVSGQTWRNWEAGKPGADKPWMLRHIAATFEVSLRWLREGGPLGPTPPDGGGRVSKRYQHLMLAAA